MDKLTQWHDGSVKPVHEGVYDRGTELFSLFADGMWHNGCTTIAQASTIRERWAKRMEPSFAISDYQDIPWRGLANKPKGIKK